GHARSPKVKPLHATLARRALLRLDSMAAPDPHSLGVPRPQFPRLCPACLPRYSLQTILRRVLISPMLLRPRRAAPPGFVEPCLRSRADRPPSGADWVHEIKHDGYRLMARRDSVGVRLLTRNGHDWAARYPLIVEAVGRLKVRSCLIDGEAVVCDKSGLAVFERLRRKPTGEHIFLYAFDLLELNGTDLRREPLETRKATLASVLRGCLPGLRLNEHL